MIIGRNRSTNVTPSTTTINTESLPAPGAHCSDSMDMHESGSTNIDFENEPEVEETSTSDDIENETEEPSVSFTSAPSDIAQGIGEKPV